MAAKQTMPKILYVTQEGDQGQKYFIAVADPYHADVDMKEKLLGVYELKEIKKAKKVVQVY